MRDRTFATLAVGLFATASVLVTALGLAGATLLLAAARSGVFGALLFEVQPTSVSSYAVGALVLLVVGLGAATIPAIRATRVDPLAALRTE